MSKENVVRFLYKVSRDEELNNKLSGVDQTAGAWTGLANDAGLEFTVDEFRAVAGDALGKKFEGDEFVSELLAAPSGELSDDQLDAVAGGTGRPSALNFNRDLTSTLGRLGGFDWGAYIREGGEPWVNYIDHGNVDMGDRIITP